MVIRTPDYRLRIFVSSTLKELADERKAVRETILKLRHVPAAEWSDKTTIENKQDT